MANSLHVPAYWEVDLLISFADIDPTRNLVETMMLMHFVGALLLV